MFCNSEQEQMSALGATAFYSCWQRKWGGGPSVIGKAIDLMTSRVPSLKQIRTAVIEEGRK